MNTKLFLRIFHTQKAWLCNLKKINFTLKNFENNGFLSFNFWIASISLNFRPYSLLNQSVQPSFIASAATYDFKAISDSHISNFRLQARCAKQMWNWLLPSHKHTQTQTSHKRGKRWATMCNKCAIYSALLAHNTLRFIIRFVHTCVV